MPTNIPTSTAAPLDPVSGLLNYFNEVKPYHTKIVEVFEQYNISDSLNVTLTDSKPNIEIDAFDTGEDLYAIGFGGYSFNIIQSPSAPIVTSSAVAPTNPQYLDIWFSTVDNVLRQWVNAHWKYVTKVYWLDTINLILYTRGPTDTGWVAPASGNGYTDSSTTGIYGFGLGGFGTVTATTGPFGPDTFVSTTITDVLTFGWGNITDWFQYMILSASASSSSFLVAGDATSDIQMGQRLQVIDSTINSGFYTVSNLIAPVFDGTNTTITVEEAVIDAGWSGFIESDEILPIRLKFADSISMTTTEELGAGIIGDSPGAWDSSYWDIGGYDGNVTNLIL